MTASFRVAPTTKHSPTTYKVEVLLTEVQRSEEEAEELGLTEVPEAL